MRNFFAPILVLVAIILYSSIFIVEEGNRALILRFGQVERVSEPNEAGKYPAVVYGPGLHFKVPVIETVRIIDAKIQTIDNKSDRFTTSENKDLMVDSYLKWQVADFDQYFVATSGGRVERAQSLLKSRLDNNLRAAIGCKTIKEIVIDLNTTAASSNIAGLGIKIIDLRIKQMNLPDEVSQDIYNRMREERKVVAQRHRSTGESRAREVRANADYEVAITLANAERQSRILRGEGDATVANLFAKAFANEPGFYSFVRSLRAYENSFKENRDVIVISPQDNEFMKFLNAPSAHLNEQNP